MLIAFLLVHRGILHRPLLYLSTFLKHHRAEYYDRLMAVRIEGHWEGWLSFFLRGVAETAEEATQKARAIVRLREDHRRLIQERGQGLNELRLLDLLFDRPLVNIALVASTIDVTDVTGGRLIDRLADLGLVDELTGQRRNRIYRYTPYWQLFAESAVDDEAGAPIQTTESDA